MISRSSPAATSLPLPSGERSTAKRSGEGALPINVNPLTRIAAQSDLSPHGER